MPKSIIVIGTLDTKGQEIAFVRDLIIERGHKAIVVDTGVRGEPTIEPTISRQDVAKTANSTISDLLEAKDKNAAIATMAKGVALLASRLHSEGDLDGVIALGGVQGTVIGTSAMRTLPVGVPKVMVSTVANGQTTFGPFVGTKDIVMMHSVADILGINVLTRQVLTEAAGAVIGMTELALGSQTSSRPTIAMTMAGVTTPCAMRVRDIFTEWGYEVIAFHCNGIGAKAMEELADAGQLQGTLDLSPHDIGGYLRGGLMQSSPDRLEVVSKNAVPIVFVPGGLDFLLFGPIESIEPAMLERNHVAHNPIHTHIRATQDEMFEAGQFVAKRLHRSNGAVSIMVPERGFSQLNIENGPLFDPEADSGFVEGVNAVGSGQLEINKLDMHINDAAFADAISEKLQSLINDR